MSAVKVLWSHARIERQTTLQTAQSSFDFTPQNSPADKSTSAEETTTAEFAQASQPVPRT
jgi:hypothetical protein